MRNVLQSLLQNAEAEELQKFENALLDLRFIIERHTQERYSEKDEATYRRLFSNLTLIEIKLTNKELAYIKHFLFYALLNYPDRSVLIAKCIKVLFDTSAWEAICTAIEFFLEKDDPTVVELIFAITDTGEEEKYFSSERVLELLKTISRNGKGYSKEIADRELKTYSEFYAKGK